MKKYFILLQILVLAVLGSACSKQAAPGAGESDEPAGSGEDIVTEISATVKDFVLIGDTKTTFSIEDGKLSFKWQMDDKLGFWPSSTDVFSGFAPQQAMFSIYNVFEAKPSRALFRTNGWGFLRKKWYSSVYPYLQSSKYNAVTIDYTGQEQLSNGSCEHLSKHDYLQSEVVIPEVAGTDLLYNHVNAVAIFEITIPESYRGRRFSEMALSSASNILVESAVFDPSKGSVISWTSRKTTSSVSMSLGRGLGIICNAEGKLVVYMMMCPTAWSGSTINITLYDVDGYEYNGSFNPTKNQESGNGYKYTISGLTVNPGVRNLSRMGTANCYIVSEAGDYKFKAVQGNGATSVDVKGVKVLWETVNTTTAPSAGAVVTNVSYSGGFIKFSTPSTFKEGNAVIAAYSNSGCTGNVLWSWHIWCTDKPVDELYSNNAGYMMDRNLGALSTTGNTSAGLFYQWGRKDPFPGTASISANSAMKATVNTTKASITSSNGTVAYSIANPTVFIYSPVASISERHLDWLWTQNGNLWRNPNASDEDARKTIYDPCPPGYRVPDGSTTANTEAGRGFWGKALAVNWRIKAAKGTSVFTTGDGRSMPFANNALSVPLVSGNASIPAAGCLADSDGALGNVGDHIMLWSNYPAGADDTPNWNTQYSGTLDVNISGDTPPLTVNWNSGRAAGKNVRCIRLNSFNPQSPQDNEGFDIPIPSEW